MEAIFYKGWTIQDDPEAYIKGQLIAYPTEQGIQHDYDLEGEDYKYCGNCLFAWDIDTLKAEIDEKIMMARPLYFVEGNPEPFEWIIEAIQYAISNNRNLEFQINAI